MMSVFKLNTGDLGSSISKLNISNQGSGADARWFCKNITIINLKYEKTFV